MLTSALLVLFACFSSDSDSPTEKAINTKTAATTQVGSDSTPPIPETGDTDTQATPTSLAEADFVVLFPQRLCSVYETCNANIECDPTPQGQVPQCDYHPSAAAACVYGDFICNNQFGPGFEYVEVPQVCHSVYSGCPGDTGP